MTREEAIKILKTERYCQEDTPILKQVRKAYDMAIEALKADTVEVVRCKDCKYIGKVGDVSVCRIHEISTRADDYCSRGERSEK